MEQKGERHLCHDPVDSQLLLLLLWQKPVVIAIVWPSFGISFDSPAVTKGKEDLLKRFIVMKHILNAIPFSCRCQGRPGREPNQSVCTVSSPGIAAPASDVHQNSPCWWVQCCVSRSRLCGLALAPDAALQQQLGALDSDKTEPMYQGSLYYIDTNEV